MKYFIYKNKLYFKNPFALALGVRYSTDVVYLKLISENNISSWGECTLPPYLNISTDVVESELISFLETHKNTLSVENIQTILSNHNVSYAAQYILSSAYLNYFAQVENTTYQALIFSLAGIQKYNNSAYTSITITHQSKETVLNQLQEYKNFRLLKIKLLGEYEKDIELIQFIRSKTTQPFCVDFNQGCKNIEIALKYLSVLEKEKVLFIEQPFYKLDYDTHYKLKQKTAIDIYGDESIQTSTDVKNYAECFDGINIKLLKCGGILPAFEIYKLSHTLHLKTIVGCMSESSCGLKAALPLAYCTDYVDLDGALLITEDFTPSIQYSKEGEIL